MLLLFAELSEGWDGWIFLYLPNDLFRYCSAFGLVGIAFGLKTLPKYFIAQINGTKKRKGNN